MYCIALAWHKENGGASGDFKKGHFMRIIHFMYTVTESDGLKGKGVRGHCEEHRVLSVLLSLLSPAFLHHC